MTKSIYLLRHGESEYNVADIILHHDTPLTQKGIAQAESCARRCEKIPFEAIVSSSYERAVRTSVILDRGQGRHLYKTSLLRGYRFPESVVGMPKSMAFFEAILRGDERRFSGGETFKTMIWRGVEALALIASLKERVLLVTSHSMFIYVMIMCMTHGKEFSYREFADFFHTFALSATALTHCVYDETKQDHPWQVVTWNDASHLSESAEQI